MDSLNQVPAPHEVTFAEINSELLTLSGPDDPTFVRVSHLDLPLYSPIQLPPNIILAMSQYRRPFGVKQQSVRGNHLLEQIWKLWEQSLKQLEDMKDKKMVQHFYYGLDIINQNLWKPLRNLLGMEVDYQNFFDFHTTLFLEHPIRLFAWHPFKQVLAIVHKLDIIFLYDLRSEQWSSQTLFHENMKEVTCLEWNPHGSSELAVGCRAGICIWKIPMDSLGTSTTISLDESSLNSQSMYSDSHSAYSDTSTITSAHCPKEPVWVNFLTYPNHLSVTSLAWDTTSGSTLLASGTALGGDLIVWDVATERAIPLRRLGGGTGILKWAPRGGWLFQSSGRIMRIWETRTWQSEQIINSVGSRVQTACWTRDGRSLFYSLDGSPEIKVITFTRPSPYIDVKITTAYDFPAEFGSIKQLAIDHTTGERLVVSFEKSELLGVAFVRPIRSGLVTEPGGILIVSGYIRGPTTTLPNILSSPMEEPPTSLNHPHPVYVAFARQFSRGALIAIAWENGRISFVPFYFMSERLIQSGQIRTISDN